MKTKDIIENKTGRKYNGQIVNVFPIKKQKQYDQ